MFSLFLNFTLDQSEIREVASARSVATRSSLYTRSIDSMGNESPVVVQQAAVIELKVLSRSFLFLPRHLKRFRSNRLGNAKPRIPKCGAGERGKCLNWKRVLRQER